MHRIARQLGAAVLTSRNAELLRGRAGHLPPGSELAGGVAAMVDGGRTCIRTVIRKQKGKGKGKKQRRRYKAERREPKLLIIFEIDEQGRMKKQTRPWIDGTFAGPDEAMELLAFHLHRLGAAAAEVVVFVADGAPWVWDRLDWVQQRVGLAAGQVVRVLDWCHAGHNLSLALQRQGCRTRSGNGSTRTCGAACVRGGGVWSSLRWRSLGQRQAVPKNWSNRWGI